MPLLPQCNKNYLVFFAIILYKSLPWQRNLRAKGKGGKFDRIVIVGIIIALLVIALTLWGPLRKFRVAEERKPAAQTKKQEPQQKKAGTKDKKQTQEAKKHAESLAAGSFERTALVAIVIDDLGQDVKQAKEVLALPGKITLAVMPGLAQSKNIAELARTGQAVRSFSICPWSLKNHEKTRSPGTLSSDMTPMEFLTTVSDDVDIGPRGRRREQP